MVGKHWARARNKGAENRKDEALVHSKLQNQLTFREHLACTR